MAAPSRISRATPAQRDELVALWQELVAHHRALDPEYPVPDGLVAALRREVDRGLGDPDCAIWISRSEGDAPRALGFLFAEMEAGPAGHGGMGWIHELFVAPGARRAGVASALVAEARDLFAKRGIERLAVRVESRNALGRDFWASHGFAEKALILEQRAPAAPPLRRPS